MEETQSFYNAYLLRIWGNQTNGSSWRIRLEPVNPQDSPQSFADFDELFAHLLAGHGLLSTLTPREPDLSSK